MVKKQTSRPWFKVFTRHLFFTLLTALCLLPFEFFLYKIFSQRSLAFGCFDDCANYMAGYFMLHGKILYSQIFYNHIMGMAWLSFLVQKLHHSINIYDLILTHRKVIMLFAFAFDLLIIKRFKYAGVLFVVLYELSKFYIFGDRFLGETVVVYAAVYMTGLVWEKLNTKKLSKFDYIISGVFAWLIIFMREPYIPLALFLYGIILWKNIVRTKIISIIIISILIILVFINTRLSDLYFNDFTVNSVTAISSEVNSNKLLGSGILSIFFYPVSLLIGGKWNIFRIFEACLSLSFLISLGILLKSKTWKTVFILVLILGAANLRYVAPGQVFYEAYHQLVWFGLFLMLTLLFVTDILKRLKKTGVILFGIIAVGWGIAVFSPQSYLFDKVDLQEQLLTNFGTVMNVGNVVKSLSRPNDTLFLDGADDMIYWESGLYSPYKYSWYTSVMPAIPLYRSARIMMFKTSPPDFYYDFCSPMAPYNTNLPKFVRESYQQLYSNGKPSCLYVKKSKLNSISNRQWEEAKRGFYTLPK